MSNLTFEQISQPITQDLKAIEQILLDETAVQYEFVDQAVRHVVEGGGKRLRPILLVLSSKACGYTGIDGYILAACVELIHVASLVHDDVLDEAPIRRGRSTLHSKWGNKVAVLVGDYLHARVLNMLVSRKSDDPSLAILSDAAQAMCEGEVIHAYKNGDFEISASDYLEIVALKTGRLISASCRMGAAIATEEADQIKAIFDYGESIGVAFQIIDDLLDFTAESGKFGKRPFNDLREGKLTFPMIYARQQCTPKEREKLEVIFNTEFEEDRTVDWINHLISRYLVKEYCLKIAQDHANQAKLALKVLPPTSARTALEQLADYTVSRDW